MLKKKTIVTDKATLLVAELPEGSHSVRVCKHIRDGIHYLLYDGGKNTAYKEYLPDGNWQLIGRIPDITEEQADKVVESYEVSHNLDLTVTLAFKDYVNGISEDDNVDYDYWDEYPFDTAVESLYSLLQANKVYFENPISHYSSILHWSDRSLKEHKDKWQEVQSKVWDRERTYLFIKEE